MTQILPDDIAQALRGAAGRVGPLGTRLTYHDVLPSTNDSALAMAAAGAADGTTVLAGAQTAGRGRQGRRWHSAADAGLYFSTVLRGIESASVTLMAGVAVTEGIRRATGLPAEIKWPNDVLVPMARGGQPILPVKVAGILAEAHRDRERVAAVVLGVGINIVPVDYPPEIAAVAGALGEALGRPVDRAGVLVEVLAALAAWRRVMTEQGLSPVLERWQALAPMSEGAEVEWTVRGTPRTGVTAGIDTDGALRVRAGDRVERVVGGEVTWRHLNRPRRTFNAAGH